MDGPSRQMWVNKILQYNTYLSWPGQSTSYLSSDMTKPTKWPVRQAKTRISLGIRPVWSESSMCAQWVAKDPSFLHAVSENSDQTGRMHRLIWIFAGRTSILLVLSRGGSFVVVYLWSPDFQGLIMSDFLSFQCIVCSWRFSTGLHVNGIAFLRKLCEPQIGLHSA